MRLSPAWRGLRVTGGEAMVLERIGRAGSDGSHTSRLLVGAVLLCLASLAIWWPGVVEYDSVEQYRQALSGVYVDWHPPVMARLWSVLHALGPGAVPMFLLQVGLYWLGLGLLAAALGRSGRPGAGVAVLLVGALPLFSAWQAAILKDTQMLGAILAAVGLVAWWRLAERRMPGAIVALVVLLLAYAALVRANAVFAVVPLAAMLVPRPMAWWQRASIVVAGVLAWIVLTPLINHHILGAGETKVARTLPIYDMAGIAHFAARDADTGILPAERALLAVRHCYQPYFWDPLGDDRHCGAIATRIDLMPGPLVFRQWLAAIARHPVAYAEHRLSHLNSTDRFLIRSGTPDADPPRQSEPNTLGLASPGMVAKALAVAGGWLAATPLGWPVAWIIVVAVGFCGALSRRESPARNLALALLVSAAGLEASFAVVSIASDLRYHLWPMIAAVLAILLLSGSGEWPKRPIQIGGLILFLVVVAATTARLSLPRSPGSYQGMLG